MSVLARPGPPAPAARMGEGWWRPLAWPCPGDAGAGGGPCGLGPPGFCFGTCWQLPLALDAQSCGVSGRTYHPRSLPQRHVQELSVPSRTSGLVRAQSLGTKETFLRGGPGTQWWGGGIACRPHIYLGGADSGTAQLSAGGGALGHLGREAARDPRRDWEGVKRWWPAGAPSHRGTDGGVARGGLVTVPLSRQQRGEPLPVSVGEDWVGFASGWAWASGRGQGRRESISR